MIGSNLGRNALQACSGSIRSTTAAASASQRQASAVLCSQARHRSIRAKTTSARSSSQAFEQRYRSYLIAGGVVAVAGLVAHRAFGQPVSFEEALVPQINSGKGAASGSFVVDPSSSVQHPLSLSTLSTSSPLTLIGVGIRTVSFLRVKVYSAGFYMDQKALEEAAVKTKGWLPGTFEGKQILAKSPKDTNAPDYVPAGEALMEGILTAPVDCAIRIVPTRNTDFGHLRDGFVRALSARQKSALKSTSLSTEQSDTISESISTFKNFFPNSSVPKGQELLLVRTFDGKLAVEYQGKSMGVLNDPWVAKEMMLAYFADQSVPSQALKESVAEGLDRMVNNVGR